MTLIYPHAGDPRIPSHTHTNTFSVSRYSTLLHRHSGLLSPSTGLTDTHTHGTHTHTHTHTWETHTHTHTHTHGTHTHTHTHILCFSLLHSLSLSRTQPDAADCMTEWGTRVRAQGHAFKRFPSSGRASAPPILAPDASRPNRLQTNLNSPYIVPLHGKGTLVLILN